MRNIYHTSFLYPAVSFQTLYDDNNICKADAISSQQHSFPSQDFIARCAGKSPMPFTKHFEQSACQEQH